MFALALAGLLVLNQTPEMKAKALFAALCFHSMGILRNAIYLSDHGAWIAHGLPLVFLAAAIRSLCNQNKRTLESRRGFLNAAWGAIARRIHRSFFSKDSSSRGERYFAAFVLLHTVLAAGRIWCHVFLPAKIATFYGSHVYGSHVGSDGIQGHPLQMTIAMDMACAEFLLPVLFFIFADSNTYTSAEKQKEQEGTLQKIALVMGLLHVATGGVLAAEDVARGRTFLGGTSLGDEAKYALHLAAAVGFLLRAGAPPLSTWAPRRALSPMKGGTTRAKEGGRAKSPAKMKKK